MIVWFPWPTNLNDRSSVSATSSVTIDWLFEQRSQQVRYRQQRQGLGHTGPGLVAAAEHLGAGHQAVRGRVVVSAKEAFPTPPSSRANITSTFGKMSPFTKDLMYQFCSPVQNLVVQSPYPTQTVATFRCFWVDFVCYSVLSFQGSEKTRTPKTRHVTPTVVGTCFERSRELFLAKRLLRRGSAECAWMLSERDREYSGVH